MSGDGVCGYKMYVFLVLSHGLSVEGCAARCIATSFCRKMMLQGLEGGIHEREGEFDVSTFSV